MADQHGIEFEAGAALAAAVLRAGGDKEALRLTAKKGVAARLAAILIAEATKPKLEDLEVFEVEVDYEGLGPQIVHYVLLDLRRDASGYDVLDEMVEYGLNQPDKLVARAALDAHKRAGDRNPVVAIVGEEEIVYEHDGFRDEDNPYTLEREWAFFCRFVAVVPKK